MIDSSKARQRLIEERQLVGIFHHVGLDEDGACSCCSLLAQSIIQISKDYFRPILRGALDQGSTNPLRSPYIP